MKINEERTFTITLSAHEAQMLKELLGSVRSPGQNEEVEIMKARKFFDSIYIGLNIPHSEILEGFVEIKGYRGG